MTNTSGGRTPSASFRSYVTTTYVSIIFKSAAAKNRPGHAARPWPKPSECGLIDTMSNFLSGWPSMTARSFILTNRKPSNFEDLWIMMGVARDRDDHAWRYLDAVRKSKLLKSLAQRHPWQMESIVSPWTFDSNLVTQKKTCLRQEDEVSGTPWWKQLQEYEEAKEKCHDWYIFGEYSVQSDPIGVSAYVMVIFTNLDSKGIYIVRGQLKYQMLWCWFNLNLSSDTILERTMIMYKYQL